MGDDSRAQRGASVSGESSGRGDRALIAFGALVAFGFLAHPLFFGEVYTAGDLGNFYLPIRDFYREALVAGHDVTWFPYEFTGFYVHGEGQFGLLHPLNLLQYRVLPLATAFGLELLRGYAALFAGAYVLLRRLPLPRDASLFGAFLASFSSFTMLHYMHLNIVGAIAHLPWLLLAMHATLFPRSRARGRLAALGVVLLTGSLCMLGHPQFVFIVSAIEAFVLGAVFQGGAPSQRVPGMPRLALDWVVAKALGFAAAGIALVPVAESLSTSFRAAPVAGFTSEFNIAPTALLQLVGPYLLDGRAPHENLTEVGLYLGAVPTVLLVHALMLGRAGASWRVTRAALVLAGLALVLSLGDWGLLYRVQSLLPVVGLFRAPARYVIVLELAVAVIAAIAFADLARTAAGASTRRLSKLHLAALLAPAILGVLAVLFGPLLRAPLAETWGLRAVGPVALGLAALLVWAAMRGVRFASFGLLALALLDICAYGGSFVARSEPHTIDAFLARYRAPANPGAGRLHWGPPALTMKGVRLAGGYAAMTPDRVLDLGPFAEPLFEIDTRLANVLRVSGVRWAIGTRLPEPLPRARLVSHAQTSADPNRDIRGIDVETTALVDAPLALDGGAQGRVEIARDAPGEIELATSAAGRQLLVVSERYHEGWRAEVDGRACRVHRVYGDYLGCVVGPGRQRVTFRFEPSSLENGARLTLVALCVTIAWLVVGWLRDRSASRGVAQRA